MEMCAHPIIYCFDSKSRIKQWQIGARQTPEGAEIVSKAGLKGGKLKTTKKVVNKGKNLGKANETTPYKQACSEAISKYQKKIDKGYVLDISNWRKQNFPMKAATYEDPNGKASMKHKITFPAHATPKLNGLCTISELQDTAVGMAMLSKTLIIDYLKVCKHLAPDLMQVLTDLPLHGELYKHGWTLEEINRCAKKYRKGRTEQLELWIYDLVDEHAPCSNRDESLDQIFQGWPEEFKIKRLPYVVVHNHEQIKFWHDVWVKEGYEGACVRNLPAHYQIDKRSVDCQKVKLGWQDAEFPIIGGKEELVYSGEDNEIEHKCIVYKCRRKDRPEVTFDCRPQGSVEKREQMYKDLQRDMGKDLKVRFFSYMESGAPEFPIGLMIRDPE